jgi:hypothetical protein
VQYALIYADVSSGVKGIDENSDNEETLYNDNELVYFKYETPPDNQKPYRRKNIYVYADEPLISTDSKLFIFKRMWSHGVEPPQTNVHEGWMCSHFKVHKKIFCSERKVFIQYHEKNVHNIEGTIYIDCANTNGENFFKYFVTREFDILSPTNRKDQELV